VKGDADDDGQNHRTEGRDAWHLTQGEGRAGDGGGPEQAGPDAGRREPVAALRPGRMYRAGMTDFHDGCGHGSAPRFAMAELFREEIDL
jgi:hypothetical protein